MDYLPDFPTDLNQIYDVLVKAARTTRRDLESCLRKASAGKGLNLQDAASLIAAPAEWGKQIFETATLVNRRLNKGVVTLYGVVYVHDYCINRCVYCGDNCRINYDRRILTKKEFLRDVRALVRKHPFREVCFLTGEAPSHFTTDDLIDYLQAVARFYHGKIILNIPPLTVAEFARIRQGLPDNRLQFRVFQETYDRDSYVAAHQTGPKIDMDNRIDAQRRALKAGFDEVGHGILYGLNAKPQGAEFDTLATLAHAAHLCRTSGQWSKTMSFPRIQPIPNGKYKIPNPVSDDLLVRCVAVVKLAAPCIETVITCRETAAFRNRLRPIINIEDYAARPGPGGNSIPEVHTQMLLPDMRSGKEVKREIENEGYRVQ